MTQPRAIGSPILRPAQGDQICDQASAASPRAREPSPARDASTQQVARAALQELSEPSRLSPEAPLSNLLGDFFVDENSLNGSLAPPAAKRALPQSPGSGAAAPGAFRAKIGNKPFTPVDARAARDRQAQCIAYERADLPPQDSLHELHLLPPRGPLAAFKALQAVYDRIPSPPSEAASAAYIAERLAAKQRRQTTSPDCHFQSLEGTVIPPQMRQAPQIATYDQWWIASFDNSLIMTLRAIQSGFISFPLNPFQRAFIRQLLEHFKRDEIATGAPYQEVAQACSDFLTKSLELEARWQRAHPHSSQQEDLQGDFDLLRVEALTLLDSKPMQQLKLVQLQEALSPVMAVLNGSFPADEPPIHSLIEEALSALRRWGIIDPHNQWHVEGDTMELLQHLFDLLVELKQVPQAGQFTYRAQMDDNPDSWTRGALADVDEKDVIRAYYKRCNLPIPQDLNNAERRAHYMAKVLSDRSTDPLEGVLTTIDERLGQTHTQQPKPFYGFGILSAQQGRLLPDSNLAKALLEHSFHDGSLAGFYIDDTVTPSKVVRAQIPMKDPVRGYEGTAPRMIMIARTSELMPVAPSAQAQASSIGNAKQSVNRAVLTPEPVDGAFPVIQAIDMEGILEAGSHLPSPPPVDIQPDALPTLTGELSSDDEKPQAAVNTPKDLVSEPQAATLSAAAASALNQALLPDSFAPAAAGSLPFSLPQESLQVMPAAAEGVAFNRKAHHPAIEIPHELFFAGMRYVLSQVTIKWGSQDSGHYLSCFEEDATHCQVFDSLAGPKPRRVDQPLSTFASESQGCVILGYRLESERVRLPAINLLQQSGSNSCYVLQAILAMWQNPLFSTLYDIPASTAQVQTPQKPSMAEVWRMGIAQKIASMSAQAAPVEPPEPPRHFRSILNVQQAADPSSQEPVRLVPPLIPLSNGEGLAAQPPRGVQLPLHAAHFDIEALLRHRHSAPAREEDLFLPRSFFPYEQGDSLQAPEIFEDYDKPLGAPAALEVHSPSPPLKPLMASKSTSSMASLVGYYETHALLPRYLAAGDLSAARELVIQMIARNFQDPYQILLAAEAVHLEPLAGPNFSEKLEDIITNSQGPSLLLATAIAKRYLGDDMQGWLTAFGFPEDISQQLAMLEKEYEAWKADMHQTAHSDYLAWLKAMEKMRASLPSRRARAS